MQKKNEVLKDLIEGGIIPVVRVKSPDEALKVAEAIKEGGINTIEITMSIPGAIDVIEKLNKRLKEDILLGAGTVLDAETARLCILSGAKFIVGPCLNLEMLRVCKRYSVIAIPGAMTPTEILTAWEAGADIVKVFPAMSLGGPDYIKAIRAPLPQILLDPTGGVNLNNAREFIEAGAAVISVGSFLVDKKAILQGKYEIITENARRFIEKVKEGREKQ
ncbi:bifunctional 2-keto-4-hydroxyglutarate aldolase/2-keto-3-deoxy-6-phosphogluconate aldolase [Candidatus Aerophobetes bacterium]|nr:bifunctional 2-keto-4-hydroxyglutarate aldolase/2-keto-3-deoxy-6-phosphogluconate aldolase [Candidatus Aerophobetes bacterium]